MATPNGNDSHIASEPRKVALVTGITGQDGSYLTEFLVGKGYEVHGLIRRSSNYNTQRINHIYVDPHNANKALMKLHYADLSDASSSAVGSTSSSLTRSTTLLLSPTSLSPSRSLTTLLMWSRLELSASWRLSDDAVSPEISYAASKVAAHWYTVNYREAYGLYACNGILFNHESPRRGENFVTRKITRALGRIKVGLQTKLFLGNIQASRDWGFAGDYVEAMWLMLQQEKPDDYVVATEESHTVEEFLEVSFGYLGLNWKDHVEIDKRYFRPTEVDNLKGDASKAKEMLKWKPKVGFEKLVKMMVDEDLETAKREKVLVDAGYIDAQQQP
ncbi:hypothetical protein Bca101_101737 [Brassica carinata]